MKESGIDMSYDAEELKKSMAGCGVSGGVGGALGGKKKVTLRVNQRQLLDKEKHENDLRRTGRAGSGGAGAAAGFSLGETGGGRTLVDANPIGQPLRQNVDAGLSRTARSLGTSLPRRLVRGTDSAYIRSSPHLTSRSLSVMTPEALLGTPPSSHNSLSSSVASGSSLRQPVTLGHRAELTVDTSGIDDGISSPLSVGGSSTTNSASEVDDVLGNIEDLEPIEAAEDLGDIDPALSQLARQLADLPRDARDLAGSFVGTGSLQTRRSVWDRGTAVSQSYSAAQLAQPQARQRKRWTSKDSNKSVMSTPSLSCPSPLTQFSDPTPYRGGRKREEPPPNMTEEQRVVWERERIKKDTHNEIEKKRRYRINDCIELLARMLPDSYDPDLLNKKGSILANTVHYIQELQKDQRRLWALEIDHVILLRNYRKLQSEMEQMVLEKQNARINPNRPPIAAIHPSAITSQLPAVSQSHRPITAMPQGVATSQGMGRPTNQLSEFDFYQAFHNNNIALAPSVVEELSSEDHHMIEAILAESLSGLTSQPAPHQVFHSSSSEPSSLYHIQPLQDLDGSASGAGNSFLMTGGATEPEYVEFTAHEHEGMYGDQQGAMLSGGVGQIGGYVNAGAQVRASHMDSMEFEGMLLDENEGLGRYGERLMEQDVEAVTDVFLSELLGKGDSGVYLSF